MRFPFRFQLDPPAAAARNMACDAALLDCAAAENCLCYRSYGWERPSASFGLTQRWMEVEPQLGVYEEVVRRPTGGGIVDHRHDGTYALALPANHPAATGRALDLYEAIHVVVAEVLHRQEIPTTLAPCPQSRSKPELACFTKPVARDVIDPATGAKLAGAAIKRDRRGILVQGSVDLARAGLDAPGWGTVAGELPMRLADAFETASFTRAPLPEPAPELVAQFSSLAWTRRR